VKILIPCAGKSSRFPGMRPKWMLTAPTGNLMIEEALKGIDFKQEDLIITILKEHEEQYSISKGLYEIFGDEITIHYLDSHTNSQAETVYKTIKELKLNQEDSILIKDSDNYFIMNEETDYSNNFICYANLSTHPNVEAANKGFIKLNESNQITHCIEKEVVSDTFSVGGYYFTNISTFLSTFEKCTTDNYSTELYLTRLIQEQINSGHKFIGNPVTQYLDWGTKEDWENHCSQFASYIIDIDGVIVENSAQYFSPKWGETRSIKENTEVINELYNAGNTIILLTSRKESYRSKTVNQLRNEGVNYHQLIMGCLHGKRYLINDYAKTNPPPSAVSINIARNDNNLRELLQKNTIE
jgi:hypothetical protein